MSRHMTSQLLFFVTDLYFGIKFAVLASCFFGFQHFPPSLVNLPRFLKGCVKRNMHWNMKTLYHTTKQSLANLKDNTHTHRCTHAHTHTHTFLVVIGRLWLLVSPHPLKLRLLSVWHHPPVIRPAEVSRATETHHKHAVPRFLAENVVGDVLRMHHLTRPPPAQHTDESNSSIIISCVRLHDIQLRTPPPWISHSDLNPRSNIILHSQSSTAI